MKIDATVKELSIGISYFDAIQGVYCSFFDISANQRMADWREPEGEGNWLPMRATGGRQLEDGESECENDQQDDDKTIVGDADGVLGNGQEETGGWRLEQLGSGSNAEGHGGNSSTTEEVSQGTEDKQKAKQGASAPPISRESRHMETS